MINLDEYVDVGTHWIALFCNRSEIVYFNSFVVEYVSEKIKEFIVNKNIIANIFWVQTSNSIMCGYICIGFIYFMHACKKLTDITSMFSQLILRTCFLHWFYKHVLWLRNKWQYNSELFQRWMKVTKQTCQNRQNFD